MKAFIKLFLGSTLIYWTFISGKLHIASLDIFIRQKQIIFIAISVWFISTCFGTFRWQSLLSGMGISISWSQLFRLTLIAGFFNTFLPGSLGGDVIKAYYVRQNRTDDYYGKALLTIFFDRILGLLTWFLVGQIAILQYPNTLPHGVSSITGIVVCSGLVLFMLAVLPIPNRIDPIFSLIRFIFSTNSRWEKMYHLFCSYRNNPTKVLYALGYSLCCQGTILVFYCYLTFLMNPGQTINTSSILAIIPLGILSSVLPISPGGLGVGHLAFAHLFQIIGVNNGADIFNSAFLLLLLPNLTGLIPYFLYRHEIKLAYAPEK